MGIPSGATIIGVRGLVGVSRVGVEITLVHDLIGGSDKIYKRFLKPRDSCKHNGWHIIGRVAGLVIGWLGFGIIGRVNEDSSLGFNRLWLQSRLASSGRLRLELGRL